jgi:hypothetical protein
VVPDSPPLVRAWLVGRDVQPLVHLARVGDDDLAADFERELESERRLADACRPDYYRDAKGTGQ